MFESFNIQLKRYKLGKHDQNNVNIRKVKLFFYFPVIHKFEASYNFVKLLR